jgi:4-hydroxybenzoate polyprenyltransferase/phosphoserine phosphatase
MSVLQHSGADAAGNAKPSLAVPLVVDLDGTLVKTDLLIEGILWLLRRHPLALVDAIRWLLAGGKARLKAEVAQRAPLDPATLPYHAGLLESLRRRKREGQPLVLATAADRRAATAVADHLGLFNEVLASDGTINLDGRRKRDLLIQRFGNGGFDYAGNARPDLAIWPAARQAILVNPDPGVAPRAARVANVSERFEDRRSVVVYLRALRPQQWLKNLLVFVPLVTSHALLDPTRILPVVLAYFAFGFCASAAYVLNDLFDLADDRRHPHKRTRALAAGDVPAQHGLVLAPALFAVALILAQLVTPAFVAALLTYLAAATAYTIALKRVVLVDVCTLAGLYTLRLIAGSAALELWPSSWLLAFSMFFFLSLALLKRFTELIRLREEGQESAPGREYRKNDLELLAALGGAAGYTSVLVLALYVDSPAIQPHYSRPYVLWFLCPLLLFWVSRAWLVAHRGNMHDDPVAFAVRDRVSYAVAVTMALVVIVAF